MRLNTLVVRSLVGHTGDAFAMHSSYVMHVQEVHREVLSGLDLGLRPSVVVGSVTHGCYMTSPTHIVHAGQGAITLAQVNPELGTLTDPGHQQHWLG
jgi:hypothetical protein